MNKVKWGHSQTLETRKKISATTKGVKKSAETRRRMSIAQTGLKKPSIQNENHWNWKGEKAGYRAKHYWIIENFGKADKCENKNCIYPQVTAKGKILTEPSRFEWALLHGKKYEKIRDNYIKLCSWCHHHYDKKGVEIWL